MWFLARYCHYPGMKKCNSPKKTNPIVNLAQYEGDPNHPDEDGRLGYLQDPTVPKGSTCPTFASAVLRIKNERWDKYKS